MGLATAAFALEVLGAGIVEDNGAEGGGDDDKKDDDDRRAGRVVPGRVGEAGEDEYIEDGEGGRFRLRPWREFSIDVIVLSSFFCVFSKV